MKRITLCIFAASLAILVGAAEPEIKPESPALPGRSNTNVVIKIKGGESFEMTYPAYPYVDTNGWVSVLPGESHVIEFDVKDGQPVNPRWVMNRTKGNESLSLKFTNDGDAAMLISRSHCSRIITMKCLHQVAGRRGLYETGINPIKPGESSYDGWPAEVVSVLLFDFKFWDDYDKAFKHER